MTGGQFANVYGRILPIDRQETATTSGCVDCGHAHWDTHRHLYVRCAMCLCGNVGRNTIPVCAETTDVTPWVPPTCRGPEPWVDPWTEQRADGRDR